MEIAKMAELMLFIWIASFVMYFFFLLASDHLLKAAMKVAQTMGTEVNLIDQTLKVEEKPKEAVEVNELNELREELLQEVPTTASVLRYKVGQVINL